MGDLTMKAVLVTKWVSMNESGWRTVAIAAVMLNGRNGDDESGEKAERWTGICVTAHWNGI